MRADDSATRQRDPTTATRTGQATQYTATVDRTLKQTTNLRTTSKRANAINKSWTPTWRTQKTYSKNPSSAAAATLVLQQVSSFTGALQSAYYLLYISLDFCHRSTLSFFLITSFWHYFPTCYFFASSPLA